MNQTFFCLKQCVSPLSKENFAEAGISTGLQPSTTCCCFTLKNKPENKNNPGGSWWGAARLSVGQVHWLHAWMALRVACVCVGGNSTASLSVVAIGDAHLEESGGTVMWLRGAGCPLVAQNGDLNDVSCIPPGRSLRRHWEVLDLRCPCLSCTALQERGSSRLSQHAARPGGMAWFPPVVFWRKKRSSDRNRMKKQDYPGFFFSFYRDIKKKSRTGLIVSDLRETSVQNNKYPLFQRKGGRVCTDQTQPSPPPTLPIEVLPLVYRQKSLAQ